jgi:hypothetical protein
LRFGTLVHGFCGACLAGVTGGVYHRDRQKSRK